MTPPDALGSLDGVPVYDGSLVAGVQVDFGGGPDARVVLGIGPVGGQPVAWLVLCPCEGIDGLVSELRDAGALAAEHHPPHAGVYPGSR